MKKKLIALTMALSMVMLSACGANAKYLKDFDASKYVTLGEYKGISVQMTQAEPSVSEEYLNGYIQYMLSNDATYIPVTDRAVEVGDVTNIDYVGKVDGVAFEGGTAQGQELVIGSGMFIEGFEDGMIGMEIGETRDVEATFPDPYTNNPDLAGKVAVFTVTLNSISITEIPELTDEYVSGLAMEGVTNVEEYRAYMYDVLLQQEQSNYDNEKANLALEAIQASSTFKDAPKGMVERMSTAMLENVKATAANYGIDAGEYVSMMFGGEAADYEETVKSQAGVAAQQYIMLQAIADAEGLNVSDEELEAIIQMEASLYGYELEAYKQQIDIEGYREFMMSENVMQFLKDNVIAVPAEETSAQ